MHRLSLDSLRYSCKISRITGILIGFILKHRTPLPPAPNLLSLLPTLQSLWLKVLRPGVSPSPFFAPECEACASDSALMLHIPPQLVPRPCQNARQRYLLPKRNSDQVVAIQPRHSPLPQQRHPSGSEMSLQRTQLSRSMTPEQCSGRVRFDRLWRSTSSNTPVLLGLMKTLRNPSRAALSDFSATRASGQYSEARTSLVELGCD
jgi:hypothetical protein